jgi:transposase-like protein
MVKVSGVLSEYRGPNNEHGRIEVLSYKANGEIIRNKLEIKKAFPPSGFVFAPRFFEVFDFSLNSLLEFSVSSIPSNGADSVVMDTNKECKKIGIEVFIINDNILENEFSIEQPKLKSFINTDSSNFFIANHGFIFGPFKNSNGDIVPKVGKEVYKYAGNQLEISLGERSYLLAEPKEILGRVDCMTPSQLSDWMKRQIHNLNINTDLTALQNALQAQELKELDKARMMRVLRNIENVSINLHNLRLLATASKSFKNLFEDQINALKHEIKEELIAPIQNEKLALEKGLTELKKSIKEDEKNKATLRAEMTKLTEEYKLIAREKDRLIEDIKIHTLVASSQKDEHRKLYTFEEQNFFEDGDAYENLLEFLYLFNNSIANIDSLDKRYIFDRVNQLGQSKFILIDNFSTILQVAKLSNNCRLFIQQVEANWINFESFYENGLRQIWALAYENPSQIHFLLLEDINMASIECYGRPVLDMLAGIRRKIPGLLQEWPKNLWILASPLVELEENNFGLPLLKKTFEHCAAFPRIETDIQFIDVPSVKVLQVNHFLTNDIVPPNFLNQYF